MCHEEELITLLDVVELVMGSQKLVVMENAIEGDYEAA